MSISLSPEAERLIAEQVRNGSYQSADAVVREGLELLLQREKEAQRSPSNGSAGNDTANVARAFEDIAKAHDADWEKVPKDLSQNVDHYLYGGQKTP